ncbi:MAG: lipid A biosynthesis acyltransferase [Gammaproteobacteria bacterium]|nr:lipid A biosynthesis acyltransferase [Gammaproteobacteria bacterium]
MTSSLYSWQDYAPRYWPTWAALAGLKLLGRLSYPQALHVGAALGALASRLPSPQRKVARRNLELCLPELTVAQRDELLGAHFREAGITLPETALTWFATREDLLSLVKFEGLETLDAITQSGRGVILLAAHFTTLEIGARFAMATRNVHAVYKPSKNKLLNKFFKRYRGAISAGLIASDDIRAMVRELKDGGIVWYAPDQAFRGKGAQMQTFFGIPVATNTATTRLSAMTGAAVLHYAVERLPGTQGYRACISPESSADTEAFHHWIEAQVRRSPAQYLWLHKRFKGLAPDYPDYYGES